MQQLAAMESYESFVRERVREGWTHKEISNFLKQLNPGERGFSGRSVRRFCSNKEYTIEVDCPHMEWIVWLPQLYCL